MKKKIFLGSVIMLLLLIVLNLKVNANSEDLVELPQLKKIEIKNADKDLLFNEKLYLDLEFSGNVDFATISIKQKESENEELIAVQDLNYNPYVEVNELEKYGEGEYQITDVFLNPDKSDKYVHYSALDNDSTALHLDNSKLVFNLEKTRLELKNIGVKGKNVVRFGEKIYLNLDISENVEYVSMTIRCDATGETVYLAVRDFKNNPHIQLDNSSQQYSDGVYHITSVCLTSYSAGNKSVTYDVDRKNENYKPLNPHLVFELGFAFKDVKKTDWHYEAEKYMYDRKYISGYNAIIFAPNDQITRGMVVTILHNIEGNPRVSGKCKFSDVQNVNEYYYNAVNWAAQNNIISGYENGKFGPNDQITREQLAVILCNYCRYKDKYIKVNADYTKFSDANIISNFAQFSMNWAVGSNIITGANGKIKPRAKATRAEAASMIYKYLLATKDF